MKAQYIYNFKEFISCLKNSLRVFSQAFLQYTSVCKHFVGSLSQAILRVILMYDHAIDR